MKNTIFIPGMTATYCNYTTAYELVITARGGNAVTVDQVSFDDFSGEDVVNTYTADVVTINGMETFATDNLLGWNLKPVTVAADWFEMDADNAPSSTAGDYGPSCPWAAPGMTVGDFI